MLWSAPWPHFGNIELREMSVTIKSASAYLVVHSNPNPNPNRQHQQDEVSEGLEFAYLLLMGKSQAPL